MNARQILVLVLVSSILVASCDAQLFGGRRRRGRLGGFAAGLGLGILGAGLLGGFNRPYGYGGFGSPYGYGGFGGGFGYHGLGYGYPYGGFGGIGFPHSHIHVY